jgi:hypothetical protein
MSNEFNTLHRLNRYEKDAIIEGLRLLANSDERPSASWVAKLLLEDDARFVECLFWAGERDSK